MNIKHKYFRYSVELDSLNSIIYITIWDEVIDNLDILSDILRYILPCGYSFAYRSLKQIENLASLGYMNGQAVYMTLINSINNTAVSLRGTNEDISGSNITPDNDYNYNEGIINAFNTMQVVGYDQIGAFNETGIRVDMEGTS